MESAVTPFHDLMTFRPGQIVRTGLVFVHKNVQMFFCFQYGHKLHGITGLPLLKLVDDLYDDFTYDSQISDCVTQHIL